jgi:hypothetical protein
MEAPLYMECFEAKLLDIAAFRAVYIVDIHKNTQNPLGARQNSTWQYWQALQSFNCCLLK